MRNTVTIDPRCRTPSLGSSPTPSCPPFPDPNTFGTKTTQRATSLACCGSIRYGWAISTRRRIPSSRLSSELRPLSSHWAAPRPLTLFNAKLPCQRACRATMVCR
ncbi:hypothetical protein LZ32DRAFT_292210 [Colletotrichum eremochloae]|nr:hypothetical protein LZ32DRAFT_292210 [Colletotrichum eremochloae]